MNRIHKTLPEQNGHPQGDIIETCSRVHVHELIVNLCTFCAVSSCIWLAVDKVHEINNIKSSIPISFTANNVGTNF
jgi:hypothetical protein